MSMRATWACHTWHVGQQFWRLLCHTWHMGQQFWRLLWHVLPFLLSWCDISATTSVSEGACMGALA